MILFSAFISIYYGAPNIKHLFDKNSIISIDINDVNNSIKTIENTIESNLYEENFKQLLNSKIKYCDFNIFNRLNKLVEENISKKSSSLEKITIHSSTIFGEKMYPVGKRLKEL